MGQVIVFADTEDLLITYFDQALAARGRQQDVGTQVPSPRPDEFVRLFVTGGSRSNLLIDSPVLTAEAWALRESVAVGTAQLLRGLVCAATHHEHGFQVRDPADVGSPVNLPDPDTAHIRYTFTTAVDVSGLPA